MGFRRLAAWLTPSFGLLILLGCQPTAETVQRVPWDQAFGAFVGEPLTVVPSYHWRSPEPGAWRFHAQGELIVHVAQAVRVEELHLVLRSAETSRGYVPMVRWDGEEILGPATALGTELRVRLGSDELQPGTHRLSLARDYRGDASRDPRSRPETDFEYVGYELDGTAVALDARQAERYQRLREFFDLAGGLIGNEFQGGMLLDGHRTVELVTGQAGKLEFELHGLEGRTPSAEIEVAGRVQTPTRQGLYAFELGAADVVRMSVTGRSGLVLVGRLFFAPEDPIADDRPSIVLVTLDTTRRDLLSPYSGREGTPQLAEFAAQATLFERALATSPWTLPSHSSIFTGLWPTQHGAGLVDKALPSHIESLGDRLREGGYYTAGVAGGFLLHHQFGLARGMHRYHNPDGFETRGGPLTDTLIEILDQQSSRPLFLFANYFDPHALFQAPETFQRQFAVAEAAAALRDRPVWGPLAAGDGSVLSDAIRGEGGFGPEVEEYLRRAYRAELAAMDAQLGRLFEALRQRDLWDDSLVVVVADHGELLGERGLFTHAHRLDPELTEIPLLIKWPGQREGFRVTSPVSQVDLFPTLLRAARLEIPEDQRGVLLYADREPQVSADRPLLFEEHESAPHPLFAEMKVARDLYGVQQADLRVIAWEGVRLCQRQLSGAWVEIECPADAWDENRMIEVVGERGSETTSSSPRSEDEEEALRALGYL